MRIISAIPRRSFSILVFLFISGVLRAFGGNIQVLSAVPLSLVPVSAGGDSWSAIVSPDGRYVIFASQAGNLTTNGAPLVSPATPNFDVFIRDLTGGTTALVSVNTSGQRGNGNSWPRAISTNNQYVLFESGAADLVPGDANNASDIFIRDVVNARTILVSVAANGGSALGSLPPSADSGGNVLSQDSVMTPDGRYVAFSSGATNLVAPDTNGISDIFVRDMQTGTTTLVSAGASATDTVFTNVSELPQITPNGRYVAFYSTAANLVPGMSNSADVYVRDLVSQTTTLASTNAPAIAFSVLGTSNVVSCNQVISDDGKYVAFETSTATPSNLTAGIILRYNLQTGLTDTVNTNAAGLSGGYSEVANVAMTHDGQNIAFVGNAGSVSNANTAIYLWSAQGTATTLASGDTNNSVPANSLCASPEIDSTGRFVTFLCNAPGLVSNVVTSGFHLYRRDLVANTTVMLDQETNGAGAVLNASLIATQSTNASVIAFDSHDAALVPGDFNGAYDIFAISSLGTVQLASPALPGLPELAGNQTSLLSPFCVSSNGQFITFASAADNLVPNDTNRCWDVFVRDVVNGTNILVSLDTNNLPVAGGSGESSISADGRFVAFSSGGNNLVSGFTNTVPPAWRKQIYVRDMIAQTNTLVSAGGPPFHTGETGNANSSSPIISSDGQHVLFLSGADNLITDSGIFNLYSRDLRSNITYAIFPGGGVAAYGVSPNGRFVFYSSGLACSVWDSQSNTSKLYTNSAISAAAINSDGTKLAYSVSSTLHYGDLTAATNVPVFTLPSGSNFTHLRCSADGRFLVAVAGTFPTYSLSQIYLFDLANNTNVVVSQSFVPGGSGNFRSDSPEISLDGHFVVYRSFANNLASIDNNHQPDLFVYDRISGATMLLSAGADGVQPSNFRSANAFFGPDSQTLVFQSASTDLASGKFNSIPTLYTCKLFSLDQTNSFPVFSTSLAIAPAAFGSGVTNAPPPAFSWPATFGVSYQVQYKDHLSDPAWLPLGNSVMFSGGRAYVADPAPNSAQRFYRIVSF